MRPVILILILAVTASPGASSVLPTIANPGFEESVPGNDVPGWGWYSRARASFHVSTENPHSGNRCLVFTNESDLEPEVYARLHQGVPVLPGVEYELSVWVRGEEVSPAIHFTDWNSYMLNLPDGTFDWRQVSVVFRTKNDQSFLSLGVNVVNRCKVLAIDDISLRAVGVPLKGRGISGMFLSPGRVVGDDSTSVLHLAFDSEVEGTVRAEISAGGKTLFEKSAKLRPGEHQFEWAWNSGDTPERDLTLTVKVHGEAGNLLTEESQPIEKLGSSISADINAVEARLEEFDKLLAQCEEKGIPTDYPSVTRAMLEQFIPLAKEDLQKGEIQRADFAAKDFRRSLDAAVTETQAYLKEPALAPNAVRYKTGRLDIEGLSFVGDRLDSQGSESRGPVFFCGYGHFFQVREDIPRFPKYGVNIIQIEVGPSATLTSEGEIDLNAVRSVFETLDRAAEQNIMVNVLLSPHYFPAWAMQKWPHLGHGGGGFLGFCVDEPEAKFVIEKFLRAVVPILRSKRALHSFCLSNEPIFDRTAGCPRTKEMWSAYLEKTYESVSTVNQRYGTDYTSFDEVPVPGNDAYQAPQFFDYCRFNHERFAGWHKWMADIIHEMAPEVPVHAKVMAWTFFQRHAISWGTDAEMFGELSQINGNDCAMWPEGGGGWATSWHSQNMAYDLQRSVARKPIFNSENHLTRDRSTDYVRPEHFRTALWQGAVHGQGATTIWVWERTYDRGYDFYGNVMDRPGCSEAVGRTCLDLNRFAEEITALQNKPAPVAIVYSNASIARSPGHIDAMGKAYTALNFCGVKIDFISEKQLADGKAGEYRIIVLAEATHLPQAAFDGLKRVDASTNVVVIGRAPQKDPYGTALAGVEMLRAASSLPDDADTAEAVWPTFIALLSKLGALPDVRLVDAHTGSPVWGVEWLPKKMGDRTIINMINLLDKPVDVKVVGMGVDEKTPEVRDPNNLPQAIPFKRSLAARDLLSLGGRDAVKTLQPMTPVLAEVK